MYGTIEHRIACHREASARRAAGRPVWDYTLKVKQFLGANPCDAAEGVFNALVLMRATIDPSHNDFDLECLIERFEEMAFSPGYAELDVSLGTAAFDDALGDLYDWADTRRVWVA